MVLSIFVEDGTLYDPLTISVNVFVKLLVVRSCSREIGSLNYHRSEVLLAKR